MKTNKAKKIEDVKKQAQIDYEKKQKENNRKMTMYNLANEFCNMQSNYTDAECYALTLNDMRENDIKEKICDDGVIRTQNYYNDLCAQHRAAAKMRNFNIIRVATSNGIGLKELQDFIDKEIYANKKDANDPKSKKY